MTNPQGGSHRQRLQRIARRALTERGLDPDFPASALAELRQIQTATPPADKTTRDLRGLLWCSIDNDDSRDLDQLTVAEALPDGAVKAMVAVADVDGLVRRRSALDEHARRNTTSVYTAGGTFPMFPDKLSTDLTSLGEGADRPAMVVEMVFDREGALQRSDIYPARVRNQAKLAYPTVAAWIEGSGPMPAKIGDVEGLAENLRMQDVLAQKLRERRHKAGALEFRTIQPRPLFDGDAIRDLVDERRNRARELIEDLMLSANGVTARFLALRHVASLRRVVRVPKHWERIVELAALRGTTLPLEPDGPALERFLTAAWKADPAGFPDLSLCVIKLIGRGEYVLETERTAAAGHFSLAVKEYAHSTAPNRRYPDLIAQRLLKATIAGHPPAYTLGDLKELAEHCTRQEDAAKKTERQVAKSAAAMLLESRLGAKFDAIVTGTSERASWIRIARPPIEGRLIEGFAGRKVGDRLAVELVRTDAERGYIDFKDLRGL